MCSSYFYRLSASVLSCVLYTVIWVNPAMAAQTHRVQAGDTLASISQYYYGHTRWKTIYDANRQLITHPDSLSAGWVLTIPANVNSQPPKKNQLGTNKTERSEVHDTDAVLRQDNRKPITQVEAVQAIAKALVARKVQLDKGQDLSAIDSLIAQAKAALQQQSYPQAWDYAQQAQQLQ